MSYFSFTDVEIAFTSFRRASGVHDHQEMSESLQNALKKWKSLPQTAATKSLPQTAATIVEEKEENVEEEFAEDAAGRSMYKMLASSNNTCQFRCNQRVEFPTRG